MKKIGARSKRKRPESLSTSNFDSLRIFTAFCIHGSTSIMGLREEGGGQLCLSSENNANELRKMTSPALIPTLELPLLPPRPKGWEWTGGTSWVWACVCLLVRLECGWRMQDYHSLQMNTDISFLSPLDWHPGFTLMTRHASNLCSMAMTSMEKLAFTWMDVRQSAGGSVFSSNYFSCFLFENIIFFKDFFLFDQIPSWLFACR